MLTLRKCWRSIILSLLSIALLTVSAASAAAPSNQTVTQGYGTDHVLQKGMIVQLDPTDSSKVQALTSGNLNQMQGVVVAANDAAVTLSNDQNNGQVFVATYGQFPVLVSDQNGAIKSGDYITISSLDGIGMKAGGSQAIVLGKAVGSFDGSSGVQGSATLLNAAGKRVTVRLGRVPVDISISHNPLQATNDDNLPGFLKKASEFIANKPVSSIRVYISLAILLISAIIAGSMLYAGIRNGLISIGRNPLAKRSIARSLLQVVLTSLIIFIAGLAGVYLLLKL